MKLYLHPKFIHIKFSKIYNCPYPLNNGKCTGLFIKTRKWQTECEECMVTHGTISKHPFLTKIFPKHKYVILKLGDEPI